MITAQVFSAVNGTTGYIFALLAFAAAFVVVGGLLVKDRSDVDLHA